MEQTTQQNIENQLPRKTKFAAQWLLIAGRTYLVVCLIVLAFVCIIALDEKSKGFSGLMPWISGLPMFYLKGFLCFLLGIEERELYNLPLVIIIGIPLLLPLLCVFFGKSLLFNRKWIKKKSGYVFVMIVLSICLLIGILAIISHVILELKTDAGDADMGAIKEYPPWTFLWLLLFFPFYSPIIFIILPSFILLFLDRKNFFKAASQTGPDIIP